MSYLVFNKTLFDHHISKGIFVPSKLNKCLKIFKVLRIDNWSKT